MCLRVSERGCVWVGVGDIVWAGVCEIVCVCVSGSVSMWEGVCVSVCVIVSLRVFVNVCVIIFGRKRECSFLSW